MTNAFFAIPGRLDTPASGHIYDRRVMKLMPSFGVKAQHLSLPDTFPSPSTDDIKITNELISNAHPTAKLVIDGLALGVLPREILEPLRERVIALIHHPLAHKNGLPKARTAQLFESEKNALTYTRHIIATSTNTRTFLVDEYNVAPEHITVAEPGTDPAPRATGTGTPLQLLAVGAITAANAYDELIDALAPISHLDWRLTIVGATDRDEEATSSLRQKIAAAKLSDRVTLAGLVVPATLARHYDSADIFVMPSHVKGYGMAVSEVMVRGITIITTTDSALVQTLPNDAALKVPAHDIAALQEALEQALQDRKLRAHLADAAWEAGRRLPTWNETARRVAAVIMGFEV